MKSRTFLMVAVLVIAFFCLFSFEKINFLTADIGRHVLNGEIFLHPENFGVTREALLHTNLFSYTYPDFPFVNHHWGSGIMAYIIFVAFGWKGLSLVYTLLLIAALLVALKTARKEVSTSSLIISGLFLAPLIANRLEVRPEALSYFFSTVFIFILFRYWRGQLKSAWLWILPAMEMIWVNTHIYFIFGIFYIGVFFGEALIRKLAPQAKKLAVVLVTSTAAAFISPYGWLGAIYPFIIFRNYGYRIVENQSIAFLYKINFYQPSFAWYWILVVMVLIGIIYFIKKRLLEIPIALSVISLTFAVVAFMGIRSIPLFALVTLPLLALLIENFSADFFKSRDSESMTIAGSLAAILIIFLGCLNFSQQLPWNRDFGLGLSTGSTDVYSFISAEKIKGPFFNNYDIGGSMIYELFPKEKVFVDNRPETYPAAFFSDVYIPMQEDDAVWRKESATYNFNAILFYRLDYTPWSQKFLLARVDDPDWAPVYVDSRTILFLRRSPENSDIISRFEIPRSIFTAGPPSR